LPETGSKPQVTVAASVFRGHSMDVQMGSQPNRDWRP